MDLDVQHAMHNSNGQNAPDANAKDLLCKIRLVEESRQRAFHSKEYQCLSMQIKIQTSKSHR